MDQFQHILGPAWRRSPDELHVVRRAAQGIQSSAQRIAIAVGIRHADAGWDPQDIFQSFANATSLRSSFECLDAAVRKVYWHRRIFVAARTLWPSLLVADRTSMVEDILRVRQWLHVFHEAMAHLEELALEPSFFSVVR